MIATNRAAPMMDHSTGKGCPPTVTMKGSGSLSDRATQGPRRAPMKPRAIEAISPPRTPPAMAFPMAPQIAAITMRRRSTGRDIAMASAFRVHTKEGCREGWVPLLPNPWRPSTNSRTLRRALPRLSWAGARRQVTGRSGWAISAGRAICGLARVPPKQYVVFHLFERYLPEAISRTLAINSVFALRLWPRPV